MRDPCRAVLKKIQGGLIHTAADTEVLQEILYRYFSIKQLPTAETAYSTLIEICDDILPITRHDMDLALDLLKKYPPITSRDAVHAAVMINHDIKKIISADTHFDLIPDIRRIPPD